jgi:small-conductance mechanosensitive channel
MIEMSIMLVAMLLTVLGYVVLRWIGGNDDD